MENNTIHVSGAVVCNLVILVFLTACVTVLVPVVRAEETNNTFFNGWNVVQTGGAVHVDLSSPPFILPPTIPVTTLTLGFYTDEGCPVGINGAPQLINPNLKSKALCRGACGPDCPTGRCEKLPMKIIPNHEGTGTCMYTNVIRCPTHPGCQEHDACYDYCEDNGYTHFWDECHLQCNQRCYDKYGRGTCTPWADLPGRGGSLGTTTADWWVSPQYSQNPLTFSDRPLFTAYEAPLSTPPTTVPTPFITPQTPPATVPTPPPATSVPATTPVVRKTVSEPDVTLTLVWTGNSRGDNVLSDVQASLTCGATQGEGNSQCSAKFPFGTKVSLIAVPHEGARLVGWYGACSGSGVCTVTMNRDKTVTADFELIPVTTPVINYQAYCSENYPGSYYNPEEGTCEYQRPAPTSGAGGSSKPTLIPLTGDCCPHESCNTRIADATGGTPPYHFSSGTFAGGGAPPMGMIIGLDGYLTGTAPAVGTYSFSVCVADLAGNTDCGRSSIIVS